MKKKMAYSLLRGRPMQGLTFYTLSDMPMSYTVEKVCMEKQCFPVQGPKLLVTKNVRVDGKAARF